MLYSLRRASLTARKIFVATWLLLIAAAIAWAQQGSNGSISGTVTDATGGVVANATVKVTSERTGETREEKTTESGDFFFGAVVPGPYSVRIEATGFRPLEQKSNMVLTSARLELGKLALELGSVTES